MITCHKQFFFDRCKERRYSIHDAMPCVVSRDGDEWTIDEDHPAYPRIKGAGTKLKTILGWFFIRPKEGCKCNDRATIMDENGPQWCRDNLETIVGWLREEAENRSLPFIEFVARQAVLQAINWADAQSPTTQT
jgi:hypothetical protein